MKPGKICWNQYLSGKNISKVVSTFNMEVECLQKINIKLKPTIGAVILLKDIIFTSNIKVSN